jgi:hypothetical protein
LRGGSIKSLEVVRFEKFRDFGSARIELNLVQVLGEQAVVTTSWKQWKETSSSKTTKNRKPSASKGLLQRGPNHHFVFQRFFLHFWMGQGWGRERTPNGLGFCICTSLEPHSRMSDVLVLMRISHF